MRSALTRYLHVRALRLGAITLLFLLGWGCEPSPALERTARVLGAKSACSAYFLAPAGASRSFDDIVARDVLPIDRAVPFGAPLAESDVRLDAAARSVTVVSRTHPDRVAHARYDEATGCVAQAGPPPRAALPARNAPTAPAAHTCAAPWRAHGVRAANRPWPDGEGLVASNVADAGVDLVLRTYLAEYPDVRAVLVVRDGQLIAEGYGRGFGPRSLHLGWSMAKTVTGMALGQVFTPVEVEAPAAQWLPAWRAPDPRARIRVRELLEMRSGLAWSESYASADSDVLRMLFAEQDMAKFAAQRPLDAEAAGEFAYSSGTSVVLQAILRARLAQRGDSPYCRFVYERLFAPIGAYSARFESDGNGTHVGSSYLHANGRDWARLGQLVLDGGVWRPTGQQVVPTEWMARSRPPPERGYGWHIWSGRRSGLRALLGSEDDAVPDDTMVMRGHWGQSVSVVPSARLVLVHLAWDTSLVGAGNDGRQLLVDVLAAARAHGRAASRNP